MARIECSQALRQPGSSLVREIARCRIDRARREASPEQVGDMSSVGELIIKREDDSISGVGIRWLIQPETVLNPGNPQKHMPTVFDPPDIGTGEIDLHAQGIMRQLRRTLRHSLKLENCRQRPRRPEDRLFIRRFVWVSNES